MVEIGKEVNVGVPYRGAKDMYIQVMYQTIQTYHNTTAQIGTYHDIRFRVMTDNLINMITDPEKRRFAKEYRSRLYKEHFLPQYPRETDDDKAHAMYLACVEVVGEVMGWIDEFVGITHFNTVNLENAIPEEMRHENKLLAQKLEKLETALKSRGVEVTALLDGTDGNGGDSPDQIEIPDQN